jgi:Tfp pilus assembly protein PilV
MKKEPQGFIALISILIVSAVLLASTLSLAQFGIANRFFVLNLEQKSTSQKSAEACLEMMRVKVFKDPTYTSHTRTTYTLPNLTCDVVSATTSGNVSSVRVSAKSGDAVTNLWALINNTTGSTTKLIEKGSF